MRIPFTLSRYIGRHFFQQLGIVFAILVSIVLLIDTIEIIRRSFDRNIPATILIEMIIMKLPHNAIQMIPFSVLLASILAFAKLTKTSELIVTRAAGISVWQFLSPALIVAFLTGTIITTTINPLSTSMLARFENLEAKHINGQTNLFSISSSGLWVHQRRIDQPGKVVIHALRVSQKAMTLYEITMFILNEDGKLDYRIDADSAGLKEKYFSINNAIISRAGVPSERFVQYQVPTSLKPQNIQESFAPPETLSFWDLPHFIVTLKAAGFSALEHQLHFHSLLVSPFFLCAMVFIAASFALGLPRHGNTGILMAAGIAVGIAIRFISNIVYAFGIAGDIPIILAAWAPMLISLLIGAILMLHFEDG